MRVGITGAAGYIGRKVLERLEGNDEVEHIVGISRRPFEHSFSKLTYVQMDVRDKGLGPLFVEHDVDTVIHLAFVVNPIHNEREMRSIDVAGAQNLLDAAVHAGVKKVIITSSTMVYGAFDDNPERLSEDHPLRGHHHYYYNIDKVRVEQLCADFKRKHPEVSLAVLRPCLVLGPTTNQFYSRLLNWPVLPLVAGRNPPLQFVHEDDVGRAYEQTLMNGAEGVFNIVGSGIVSWKDVIVTAGKRPVRMPRWLVCALLKLLWGLRLVETPADVLDFVTYPWVASGEKARKGLGFSPTYSSEQTLRAFLAARGKI